MGIVTSDSTAIIFIITPPRSAAAPAAAAVELMQAQLVDKAKHIDR